MSRFRIFCLSLLLLIVIAVFGSLVVIYGLHQYNIWKFRKCFRKHFPEISEQCCHRILKENNPLLRKMVWVYVPQGSLVEPEPSLAERLVDPTLTSEIPTPLNVFSYFVKTPSRLTSMMLTPSKEDEMPTQTQDRVLLLAAGLRSSLSQYAKLEIKDVSLLDKLQAEMLPRFRQIWAEWLEESGVPAEVNRGLSRAFEMRP